MISRVLTEQCGDECPHVPGVEYVDSPVADPAGQGENTVLHGRRHTLDAGAPPRWTASARRDTKATGRGRTGRLPSISEQGRRPTSRLGPVTLGGLSNAPRASTPCAHDLQPRGLPRADRGARGPRGRCAGKPSVAVTSTTPQYRGFGQKGHTIRTTFYVREDGRVSRPDSSVSHDLSPSWPPHVLRGRPITCRPPPPLGGTAGPRGDEGLRPARPAGGCCRGPRLVQDLRRGRGTAQ